MHAPTQHFHLSPLSHDPNPRPSSLSTVADLGGGHTRPMPPFFFFFFTFAPPPLLKPKQIKKCVGFPPPPPFLDLRESRRWWRSEKKCGIFPPPPPPPLISFFGGTCATFQAAGAQWARMQLNCAKIMFYVIIFENWGFKGNLTRRICLEYFQRCMTSS